MPLIPSVLALLVLLLGAWNLFLVQEVVDRYAEGESSYRVDAGLWAATRPDLPFSLAVLPCSLARLLACLQA